MHEIDNKKHCVGMDMVTYLLTKGVRSLLRDGVKGTWKKVKKNRCAQNHVFVDVPLYTEEEMNHQRMTRFDRDVRFSILVPLYNTPEQFLHEMIMSVRKQTYGNWELCLADGSDLEHQQVGEICRKYAGMDNRIVYQKLEKNMGMSGNANACIDMSTGDYIALFAYDDILHSAALYDVMKAICEQNADFIYTDEAVFESPDLKKIIAIHCKPDYAVDNLRANNYICHFSVFSRKVMERAGKFRAGYDGSQDHDLMLRLTAKADKIVHVPKVLYYRRSHPMSAAKDNGAKTHAVTAGRNAVRDSIAEYGYKAVVESSRAFPDIYRIKYELLAEPKVSIIIPNKNHVRDLRRCLGSVFGKTTYMDYEVIIVDNGSDDPETLAYYEALKVHPRVVFCCLDIPFNYSTLNNFAAKHASGEYYILLNNDTEVITPGWIEEMLMYVQREDVAAAGAMLYYPDDTIQHAGIILGLGADRIAGHPFYRYGRRETGYMGRLCYSQNMSAVTAACMMVKASVYQEIGGFDERFAVAYNDVDLCMRMRKAGYLIVWTPHAELYHYESRSRGQEDTPEKRNRFLEEADRFRKRWEKELAAGDPYYNPNLTLDYSDFRMHLKFLQE